MRIHIPGAGDHSLVDVSVLPDPCALSDDTGREQAKNCDIAADEETGQAIVILVNMDDRRRRPIFGSDNEDHSAELAGERQWKGQSLKENGSDMFHNHRRTNLTYNTVDVTPEDIAAGKDNGDDGKEEYFFP
ncbi:unnamed protein product [Absidia cylindrospora]